TMATGEHVITEPTGEFSATDEPQNDGAGIADADIAAALGVELTEPAALQRFFGQPNERGVEDDLKYILDATPPPPAVREPVPAVPAHRPAYLDCDDDPPPF
ncbi:hypothetical protein, partial [Rhodococcus sp. HNM0569]|uniref:hypothetical protein n=1 Tax=Rhodococcus sp. HNM0569 TaxID=2716340 RepID=UPI00146E210B